MSNNFKHQIIRKANLVDDNYSEIMGTVNDTSSIKKTQRSPTLKGSSPKGKFTKRDVDKLKFQTLSKGTDESLLDIEEEDEFTLYQKQEII